MKRDWEDLLELLVAIWVFCSPVVLGYFDVPVVAGTAMLLGAVLSFSSQLGLAVPRPWEEWTSFAIGAMLIASPWVMGYAHLEVPMWNAVASGVVIIVLAIFALERDYATEGHPAV
jgi:hypothetical protein